jgi:hypothetical protein
MARIEFYLDRFAEQARAKAATLDSARQRRMLDVYIEHVTAEVAGEFDRLMATMCPDPNFHIWVGGTDIGPKGRDAVEAMYRNMIATVSNFMDMDLHRILVDDSCIMKEYTQRKILSGRNLTTGTWVETLRAQGQDVDLDAHYLTKGRTLIILPFDDECRMLGEDGFTAGSSAVRELSPDEVPEAYLARL